MAFVHECWEQALDLNSGQPYWFNRATGVSQWHPPPDWSAPAGSAQQQSERREECDAQSPTAAPAAGEAGAAQPPAGTQWQGQKSWDPQWQRRWDPGLYYRDAADLLQGPFTMEQLQGWRGMLPMDLPVLRLTAGSSRAVDSTATGSSGEAAAAGDPDSDGQSEHGLGGRGGECQSAAAPAQQDDEPDSMRLPRSAAPGHARQERHTRAAGYHQPDSDQRPGAAAGVQPATHCQQTGGAADQEQAVHDSQPEAAHPQGPAGEQQPEAEAAERQGSEGQPGAVPLRCAGSEWEELVLAELLGDGELLGLWRLEYPEQAAWPGTAPPAPVYAAERARGTAYSLAEAVLSGLPAHDEAVALARAAAAAGKSLQEVAAWGREVDYSATAYRVAARGRIQAGDAKESLYAEAASWANPAELEQQLARAAERRKRGLRGEELRAMKQRKADLKEKKRREWLFT